MNAFSTLSAAWQTVIPLLLTEAVLELGLFLYQILRSRKTLRGLPCAVCFGILVTLLFSVTQGDPDEGKDAFLCGAPWLIFAAVILLAAVHFAVVFPLEYRRRKKELSPASIKEATDKLPMSICFADPDGRLVLCNDRMRRMSFALCGRAVRTAQELQAVLALCAYAADKTIGTEMLNWLCGPRPLNGQEISFLNDRFRDGKTYLPFTYFAGATPDNSYTPSQPYTITIESNHVSGEKANYMKLFIPCGGADDPRPIKLRQRGSDGKWFLWEQYLLTGVRTPKAEDPWA